MKGQDVKPLSYGVMALTPVPVWYVSYLPFFRDIGRDWERQAMLSRFLSRLREGARKVRQALRVVNEAVEDFESILKIVAVVTLVTLYVVANVDLTAIEVYAALAWQATLQMLHQFFPFVP